MFAIVDGLKGQIPGQKAREIERSVSQCTMRNIELNFGATNITVLESSED